jgi:LysM repeat protein
MLKIDRKSDSRIIKAILHRLADIPGGVTVSVADLGGSALVEGTPICVGSNGLYNVMKTGKVVTEYSSGTSLEIAKGSHFKVNDKITNEAGAVVATISAIDKTNAAKDVLTLSGALGVTLAVGAVIVLCTTSTVNHGAVVQGAVSATDATSFNVDKGHTLAIGDKIAGTGADPMTGKTITNIDRGSDLYDVITIGAANGKALADDEAIKVVTATNGVTAKDFTVITVQAGPAVAIVGSNNDVTSGESLFVDAWLIGVVKEANGPAISSAIKAQLSGIKFI